MTLTIFVTILMLIFVGLLVWVFLLLIAAWMGSPRAYAQQREVDLRLTYKRYMEIYPSARVSYSEYKRMQMQSAYRKAVSSTKIKRMVR